jgi:LPS O-antigen subunit length determinant protein (WzzB/FepE family)
MTAEAWTWPQVILILGLGALAFCVFVAIVSFIAEQRKQVMAAGQANDLRQLVERYEQLAEKTLDAQQRTAADVSEVRSRLGSVEQILRTVD